MEVAARRKTMVRPGVVQEMRGWPCILRGHCADAIRRKQALSRPSPQRGEGHEDLRSYNFVGGEKVERRQAFFTCDVLTNLDGLRGQRGALGVVTKFGCHQRRFLDG